MSIGGASRGSLGLGAPADVSLLTIPVPSTTFVLTTTPPAVLDNDAVPAPSVAFSLVTTPPVVTQGPVVVAPSTAFVLTTTPPLVLGSETLIVPPTTFSFTVTPPLVGDGAIIPVASTTFTLLPAIPDILLDSVLLERAVNAACTDQVFILLLTIEHPSLSSPVTISNDATQLLPVAQVRGTVSNGAEYVYIPFDFVFPNQEGDTAPIAKLMIDNVSREISTIIEGLSTSPSFGVQVVLSDTPDIVELEIKDFTLRKIDWDITQVTGEISGESFESEPFPAGRFNPSSFPSLFAN